MSGRKAIMVALLGVVSFVSWPVSARAQDADSVTVGGAAQATRVPLPIGAQLSWSVSDTSATDLQTPGSLNRLYLILTRGVSSFKGAEFDLRWDPPGNGEDCAARVGTIFRTSTTCTYLNRGNALSLAAADTAGHYHVSWANSAAISACTSGAIVEVWFAFGGCPDSTVSIELCSLSLMDADGRVVEWPGAALGVPATVHGGRNSTPICSGSGAGAERGDFARARQRATEQPLGSRLAEGALLLYRARGSVSIDYEVKAAGYVRVAVYSPDGRRVREILSGTQPAGRHSAKWDGTSDSGTRAPTGLYYVREGSGAGEAIARILVLR